LFNSTRLRILCRHRKRRSQANSNAINLLAAAYSVDSRTSRGAGITSAAVDGQRLSSWRFGLYFWSLLAMLLLVAAAIAVDWAGLDPTTRLIFLGPGCTRAQHGLASRPRRHPATRAESPVTGRTPARFGPTRP
jgi:hypothetical protein